MKSFPKGLKLSKATLEIVARKHAEEEVKAEQRRVAVKSALRQDKVNKETNHYRFTYRVRW